MLSHLSDRFYVVTKFILPVNEDVEFLLINFCSECNYLKVDLDKHRYPVQHLTNSRNLCLKIVSFVYFYKNKLIPITKQLMTFS